jgi:hypothetical protein
LFGFYNSSVPKKHPRHCAYRGKLTTDVTDDHVAPDCLWEDRPLPDQMVTVYTCGGCNSYWSIHEGFFRTMVALLARQGGHPVAKQIIQGGAGERHFWKDAKFRRTLTTGMTVRPAFNPLGLYVGHQAAVNMDWRRRRIVVGKIARGLFFTDQKHRLPETREVFVWQRTARIVS